MVAKMAKYLTVWREGRERRREGEREREGARGGREREEGGVRGWAKRERGWRERRKHRERDRERGGEREVVERDRAKEREKGVILDLLSLAEGGQNSGVTDLEKQIPARRVGVFHVHLEGKLNVLSILRDTCNRDGE